MYDFTGQLPATSWLVRGIQTCAGNDMLAGIPVRTFDSAAADKVGTKVLNAVVSTDTRIIRLTFDGAAWTVKERDRVAGLALPLLEELR